MSRTGDERALSVIVSTNRLSPFLDDALGSVSAQSFDSWEGIVIDDGVPDREWLEQVVSHHPRFRIVAGPRMGVSRARNVGASLAVGKYLAFLDDDDRWQPDRMERFMNGVGPAGVVGAFCPVRTIDEWGRVLDKGQPIDRAVGRREILRRESWIACPNFMVRRDIFDRVGGFDPKLSLAEDLDLVLRVVDLGEIVAVRDPLVDYRTHSGNTTANRMNLALSVHRVIKANRARQSPTPEGDRADYNASLRKNARYAVWAFRTSRWAGWRVLCRRTAQLVRVLGTTPWVGRGYVGRN